VFFIPVTVLSQHQGFIYGDIVLKNKKVYRGQIRWSAGQSLWSDVLIVAKQHHPNLKYLSEYQLNHLYKPSEKPVLDWQFMNLWKDKYPSRKSEVLCRFGDISRIHVTGNNVAQIYYKSGNKLRVTTDEQNTRHLGKDIVIYGEGGVHRVDWEEISSINFRNTPAVLPQLKGNPLYGTVMTSIGPLSGYIQWGKSKNSDNQHLKGRSKDGATVQFLFKDIATIEKSKTGSVVELKSGKSVFLDRTEDVSAAHDGIVVTHPSWGRVVIDWKAFRSVSFEEVAVDTGYDHYPKARKIYGIIKTKDQQLYKGNCVFDMDEEWDFDLLEGRKDGISYQIPFRYVSQIVPLNTFYTKIVLQSGKVLVLGHHNDVTARNWGAMIWQANAQYKYIPWTNILEMKIR